MKGKQQEDPFGIRADLNRRIEEFHSEMVKLITGYPSRRAEYVAAHSQEWVAEGARLQAQRERAGVTRGALAKALGVSTRRIARLEMGKPVRDARLLRAAVVLALESSRGGDAWQWR